MRYVLILLSLLLPWSLAMAGDYEPNEKKVAQVAAYPAVFQSVDKKTASRLAARYELEKEPSPVRPILRHRWVKIKPSVFESLKALVEQVLADGKTEGVRRRDGTDYRGEVTWVRLDWANRIKVPLNFSVFDDLNLGQLYLSSFQKAWSHQGRVEYVISLSTTTKYKPHILIQMADRIVITTGVAKDPISIEQKSDDTFLILQRQYYFGEAPPMRGGQAKIESNQKRPEAPLSLAGSAMGTLDILVVYDGKSDQSLANTFTIATGLETLNRLLEQSNIPFLAAIKGYEALPNPLCGSTANCNKSYQEQLNELAASNEIKQLKIAHKADIAVIIRSTRQFDGPTYIEGMAKVAVPGDPMQAHKAVALVHQQGGRITFAHEVAHVLGADHSSYNPAPGNSPAVAQLTFYDDTKHSAYHRDGLMSFMTYEHICENELIMQNLVTPGRNSAKCDKVEQLSSNTTVVPPWSNIPVPLGSGAINNRDRVNDISYKAVDWDKALVNQEPQPAIYFAKVPGIAGLQHCFDARQSVDPDGDDMTRFYWFVRYAG